MGGPLNSAGSLIFENARDFADALPEGGALLGLDLGTKTIGTAVCDAGWRFASNGTTITRAKWGRDRELLGAIIRERSVKGIVLGLPLNMDGTEGPRAQSSRAYAKNCAEAFALPVLLWDERWSTQSALGAMIGQDMSRAKRAASIDSPIPRVRRAPITRPGTSRGAPRLRSRARGLPGGSPARASSRAPRAARCVGPAPRTRTSARGSRAPTP